MKKKRMYAELSQAKIDMLNRYVKSKGGKSQSVIIGAKIENLRVIKKPKLIPTVEKEDLTPTSFWLAEEQHKKANDCIAAWGITKNEFYNRLVDIMARELGM